MEKLFLNCSLVVTESWLYSTLPKKVKSSSLLKRFMIILLLLVASAFPNNLYAAGSTSTATGGTLGGAFWMGLLCYFMRKRPIGGWLLYYFICLYVWLIVNTLLSIPSLPDYNPIQWGNKLHYFLFILATIPFYIFLLIQVFLSFYLLPTNRRDWKHIKVLKTTLFLSFVFSLLSVPIGINLWPDSVFLDVYSAVLSLLWFLYFKRSSRVKIVFKDKNWNWDALYPKKYSWWKLLLKSCISILWFLSFFIYRRR